MKNWIPGYIMTKEIPDGFNHNTSLTVCVCYFDTAQVA